MLVYAMSLHGLLVHFFSAWNNIPLSECTTEGHLGCLQVWAIMHKAVENLCGHVFQLIWVNIKE